MRKAQRLTANQDKGGIKMKRYEEPGSEIITLDRSDLITTSFGNLPELDGNGTDTPTVGWGW